MSLLLLLPLLFPLAPHADAATKTDALSAREVSGSSSFAQNAKPATPGVDGVQETPPAPDEEESGSAVPA